MTKTPVGERPSSTPVGTSTIISYLPHAEIEVTSETDGEDNTHYSFSSTHTYTHRIHLISVRISFFISVYIWYVCIYIYLPPMHCPAEAKWNNIPICRYVYIIQHWFFYLPTLRCTLSGGENWTIIPILLYSTALFMLCHVLSYHATSCHVIYIYILSCIMLVLSYIAALFDC